MRSTASNASSPNNLIGWGIINTAAAISALQPTGVKEEVPRKFTLEQNYPNPFNPRTTIRFQVPDAGFVSLKVYNLLGHEVGTLVNGNVQAGSFTVTWDASSFPSGIYFYRLQAGGDIRTRSMMLVK